jgi:hypothetical protein
MNDYRFAEIVTCGARNRGKIYPVENILTLDYYGKKPVTDAYSSIYLHTQDYATFDDGNGGKRGYNGPVKAEFLHFDFDSPHDDLALREVRAFTENLCGQDKYGLCIDDFRFWFSGNKGFHVYINTEEIRQMPPAVDVPDKIKSLCIFLAGKFSTFDKSVYDRTRIFRIPNSRHGKTGLFKIPVLAGELWENITLEEIKSLATQPRSFKIAVAQWLKQKRKVA